MHDGVHFDVNDPDKVIVRPAEVKRETPTWPSAQSPRGWQCGGSEDSSADKAANGDADQSH